MDTTGEMALNPCRILVQVILKSQVILERKC